MMIRILSESYLLEVSNRGSRDRYVFFAAVYNMRLVGGNGFITRTLATLRAVYFGRFDGSNDGY